MPSRLEYPKAYSEAYKAMAVLSSAVARTGVRPQLIDLVYYRVSQLNGCAYCLGMHSKDLRARGETEQRLYLIGAWSPQHLYGDRDRAALAWLDRHAADAAGNMLNDVATGRPSELETQIGAIVRLARDAGVEVPCHAFLYFSLLPPELPARGQVHFPATPQSRRVCENLEG
jgi:AhpD family alkylhydroperoxidase